MLNIILGGLAVAGFFLLINFTKAKGVAVSWWQWLLTVLAFVLAVFTIAAVGALISEDAPTAALVTGLIFGIITIVFGVLLGRFVFAKTAS